MKRQKLLSLFLILFVTSNAFANDVTKSDAIAYFNELTFGAEFGDPNNRCTKWTKNIKIFVSGKYPEYLHSELNTIITELNELIETIQVSQVNSIHDSNYIIFFGPGEQYAKMEPNAKPYIKNNWGLFWVYWNFNREIFKGSMYVDTTKTTEKEQKHLLREELTQSLGIMHDSNKYPESIFYQKWTHTTNYSDIDKYVIKLLYLKKIRTNMNKQEINQIIISEDFIDIK